MSHSLEVTGGKPDNILFWWNADSYQNTVQGEMRLKNRNPGDPEQAPAPEEGDRILLLATFIGIILGGIAGFFVGYNVWGANAVLFSIIVGILVGGFIGVYTGSYIKKRNIGDGTGPSAA